jgi:hypothetical protein
MNYEKRDSVSALLESANQMHLTIYIENRGNIGHLRYQLKTCIKEAKEGIGSALNSSQRKAFLLPIEGLLEDNEVLKQLKGNIGIFRTRSSFRVLSLPVDVTRSCHVASTFHVKPLLRWMQWQSEFMLLGLEKGASHLYYGTQEFLRKVDTVFHPSRLVALLEKKDGLSFREQRELKEEAKSNFAWVSDWVCDSTPRADLNLYLAGEADVVKHFLESNHYKRTVRLPVAVSFSEDQLHRVVSRLRDLLRAETRKSLEHALLTFKVADEMKVAEDRINEIAKAAVQGRVRKLIIAENREIFGKLDPRTGRLSLHPFDLDHEDDDLLDDLAQRVLIMGGEVYLAKEEEIPRGNPIMAILDGDPSSSGQQGPTTQAAEAKLRGAG